MFPNIYVIAGVPFSLHDTLVGLGILVACLIWWHESKRLGLAEDERLWWIGLGALCGAVVGMRLGTWPQHWDPRENLSFAEQWNHGSRSIISALGGAYLGVVVAKRMSGYAQTTGDAFAPAVALGMAIGRVGCLLTEVPGTPTGGSWGIVLPPAASEWLPGAPVGVPLHPSFVYEIVFHLTAFALLWRFRRRALAPGTLFRWYVLAYAAFRFTVEFVRGNDDVWWGLSRPQWFLLTAMVAFAVWRAVRRWHMTSAASRTMPAPASVPA